MSELRWAWHNHIQLIKAAYYCGINGWRFTFRRLDRRPTHWVAADGRPVDTCGWCRFGNKGTVWIEVAYVKGTSLNNAVASVWHEIGHAESYKGIRPIPPVMGAQLWYEEAHAWEVGLALAGERGFRMTKHTAAEALRSLLTYSDVAVPGTIHTEPAVRYLREMIDANI